MNPFWKIATSLTQKTLPRRRQEIINSLLKSRGLKTESAKKQFFSPPQPSELKAKTVGLDPREIKKAKKRIRKAIADQELIYIYGDYDADGVCSTTILWENLNALGAQVMPYIPFREDRVRGLSVEGIDQIIASAHTQPDLIITVDNGISAFEACDYAKKINIDIIITDHHLPKAKLPQAEAIVHTTQLAGAGVAWYLARSLTEKADNSLDVAALGTIADMVPLLVANRSLVRHGLQSLRQSRRPGLLALADKAKLNLKEVTARQVGYVLSPRLNAMARLEHALDSVRLLCLKNVDKAKKLAESLEGTNQNRQEMTETMMADALAKVDKNKKLLFVASKDYHEGIVGLVAGRLAERYHRPAVVVAIGESHAKASSRSIDAFNLTKAIRGLKTPLLNHGGHKLAAGFTLEVKHLAAVEKELVGLAEKTLTDQDLQASLDIDALLEPTDINWELERELSRFKPFGMGNPEPLFASEKVTLASLRAVGVAGQHLKLQLKQRKKTFDAIAFGKGYLAAELHEGQLVDVAYTIEINEFNGQKSLQLKVRAINPA